VTERRTDGQTDGRTGDTRYGIYAVARKKTAGRILSINTSNDAFSAKDVPFGVRKFKFKFNI